MSRQVQVTFDAHDPGALSSFWRDVLGYVHPGPPGVDLPEDADPLAAWDDSWPWPCSTRCVRAARPRCGHASRTSCPACSCSPSPLWAWPVPPGRLRSRPGIRLPSHVTSVTTGARHHPPRRLAGNLSDRVVTLDAVAPYALTYGMFRPRILVSSGLLRTLSDAELAAVLAREREHLCSRDPLKN